jgi:hypothetical protein
VRYFGVYTLFSLHSTRRTQCTPISASKQALRLAKLNLSSLSTKTVISFLTEVFRRLDAIPTPFYAPNKVHAEDCVVISPATRKTQSFFVFDENSVNSFLTEIFWRLNALSTPFYAAIAVHSDFSVETSPATRKTQSFLDFEENSVISFLTEIF